MAVTAREITWRRDYDAAFEEARRAGTHVLVDFSAAPM
jgi:hypothetical protein